MLLPYIDQSDVYRALASGDSSKKYQPMGPRPWNNFAPFRADIPGFLCPSDPEAVTTGGGSNGRTSYGMSVGDTINNNTDSMDVRGLFARYRCYSMRDVTDGTSNTVALAEIAVLSNAKAVIGGTNCGVKGMDTNPMACMLTVDPNAPSLFGTYNNCGYNNRGRRWADGRAPQTRVSTVLPPNGPTCLNNDPKSDNSWGLFSAQSYHAGGVNALLADGSVRFINQSINTGDLTAKQVGATSTQKSPYGVWGALGSKAGREALGEF